MKIGRCVYFFISVVLIFLAGKQAAIAASGGKEVYVVFRYDDFSARSATDLEEGILKTFQEIGAPVTFGVIPFVCSGDSHSPSSQSLLPLSPEKQAVLVRFYRDGVLDVALHGYSHQSLEGPPFSEFSGMDYGMQLNRIREGKRFLEGIVDAPVTSFVPPWNLYDANTLKALKVLGFKIVSADFLGTTQGGEHITFLPYTCEVSNLREMFPAAGRSAESPRLIIALFHPYDFLETDAKRGKMDFQGFRDLLLWVKSQPEVCLISLQQAGALKKSARPVSAESAR